MMNKKTYKVLSLSFLIIVFCACKKLVEVDGPATSVSSKDIYNNDATAIGALTYFYADLSSGFLTDPGSLNSVSCITGLSGDELTYYNLAGNNTLSKYFENALTSSAIIGSDYWTETYRKLYQVNAAIEGLTLSTSLNQSVKRQLLGEAKFLRAFYYFYLVNLYGDVPLVLSTDYTENALIAKTPKTKVYEQIVQDLKEAQILLSEQYLRGDAVTSYPNGVEERIRPTKWAATALLARVYLFLKEWSNAESQVTSILQNTAQFGLVDIDEVFLKNNKEAIWQLQPVRLGYNTMDGDLFVIPAEGPSFMHPVYLNTTLINSFEMGDKRREKWTGKVVVDGNTYYYPLKYKLIYSSAIGNPVSEYPSILRLAEQVLIRAEARAQQGNLSGAMSDVDLIRVRSNLRPFQEIGPNIGKDVLIREILKEKQIEFFSEWGHRWFDLKRTGAIDQIMSIVTPQKANGGIWKSYQQDYPIGQNELRNNPNLVQTPGY